MKKTNFGLLAVALCLTPLGKANIIYTFSMNTTPLVGNGPFTLDLQFLDGSGLPVDLNNNTVALTNFAFGAGGSPSGGGTVTGGASGSLDVLVGRLIITPGLQEGARTLVINSFGLVIKIPMGDGDPRARGR